MKYLLLPLLLLFFAPVWAQKEKKSTGEYQLNLSRSNLSEAEGCERCKELARVEAIEKVFGTVIIQGNATSVRNTQTGEEVQTEQVFSMMAETYVNGDWIKTLDEECERMVEGDEFWLRCKVKGVVRELSKPKHQFDIRTLSCEAASCEKVHYRDGDPFYLYLKSPAKGYMSIYLADEQVAQRIFPYRNMPEDQLDAVKVKADREYLLFSRAADPFDLGAYVDEYELFAESAHDLNRVFVIYSEEPLAKPGLSRGDRDQGKIELPMQLSVKDFRRWLSENRRFDPSMQVERVDITISKE